MERWASCMKEPTCGDTSVPTEPRALEVACGEDSLLIRRTDAMKCVSCKTRRTRYDMGNDKGTYSCTRKGGESNRRRVNLCLRPFQRSDTYQRERRYSIVSKRFQRADDEDTLTYAPRPSQDGNLTLNDIGTGNTITACLRRSSWGTTYGVLMSNGVCANATVDSPQSARRRDESCMIPEREGLRGLGVLCPWEWPTCECRRIYTAACLAA